MEQLKESELTVKPKIGFWTIFLMALSSTIGGGLLISFGQVAQLAQNPVLTIVSFLIGGIILIPEMMLMSETAYNIPANGSTYSWIREAGWSAISFWFGWILVLIVAMTALSSVMLSLANLFTNLFSLNSLWYGKLIVFSFTIILICFHAFIKNYSQISQIIFTILKFIPIFVILLITFIHANFNDFAAGKNESTSLYLSTFCLIPAISMTMFAYSGTESITYVAGDVKNPQRNIPKALIISTATIILIYVVLLIALLLIAPFDKWSGTLNVWISAIISQNLASGWIITIEIASFFLFAGSINAFIFYFSKLIQQMAFNGDLFSFFSKENKNENPYLATLLLLVGSLIYFLWDKLMNITNYYVFANSLLKFVLIFILIYHRLKRENYVKLFNEIWYWLFICISIISLLITTIGPILTIVELANLNSANTKEMLINSSIILTIILAGIPIAFLKKYIQNKIKK
ncbi:APC family permease [Spiroplasma endosymbiont of Labia minor]|uniref:APC family permease n=1 Tax=Spiroplasma endosymbiont of Labia minor TaxID=3066305 RepID=UPI0030CCAEA8